MIVRYASPINPPLLARGRHNPLDVHISFLLGLQESSGQESSKPELGLCYYAVCPPDLLDESPCLLGERFRRLLCGHLRKTFLLFSLPSCFLFHHVSLLTYHLQILFHAHPHLRPLALRPLVLFLLLLAEALPRGRGFSQEPLALLWNVLKYRH